MNNKKTLSIAKKFSTEPGLRLRSESNYSGEEFLQDYFIPWLKENKDSNSPLEIDLNGAIGYGPSFLEETFGGAVRAGYGDQIKNLEIIYEDENIKQEIKRYIDKSLSGLKN